MQDRVNRELAGTEAEVIGEMPVNRLPILLVAYDLGAASPLQILSAARGVCKITFIADRERPHVAGHYDAMRKLADVVDITGLNFADACKKVSAVGADGIVTFSEFQQLLVSDLADKLQLKGHHPQTARLLTDKLLQRRRLSDAGVQTTRIELISSEHDIQRAAAEVGFPAVLKPRHGAASANTRRVESVEQCAAVVQALSPEAGSAFVLEELLVGDPNAAGPRWGDFVSVESIVQNGAVQTVCVVGKHQLAEPFRESGDVLPHTMGESLTAAVVRLERAALTALGVRHGVCHTEIKLTPNGPRIIEVNGRMAGYLGDLLRRASGTNMVRAVLQVALGLPVTMSPPVVNGVAYQRFIIPPFGAREVVSLSPLDKLAELPGVDQVEVRAHVGRRVDWRTGTQGLLAIVHGSVPGHKELLSLIEDFESAAKECCI